MRISLIFLVIASLVCSCSHRSDKDSLQATLEKYCDGKDATIGIAIIGENIDTVSINGDVPVPMLSIMKFPQALALVDLLDEKGLSLNDSIDITEEDLIHSDRSPMVDKYGLKPLRLSYGELLMWTLSENDRNACDVLFRELGGTKQAQQRLAKHWNAGDINMNVTEAAIKADSMLSYQNTATPLAIASLFQDFETRINTDVEHHKLLKFVSDQLERCRTGVDRLGASLPVLKTVLGHKSGTGFVMEDGRLMALNDAGYIELADGRSYSIAVFIVNSGYSKDETSAMIADISEIVYKWFYANA